MSTVTVADARARFSDLIDRSRTEAVVLEHHGHAVAVVISLEQYERMRDALESVEDAQAFDAAMAEEAENVPWARAAEELSRELSQERRDGAGVASPGTQPATARRSGPSCSVSTRVRPEGFEPPTF
ncbi:type II toxin-antitoxin system Phd/YefM family antitoxin [Rathayibacter sp. VKM Ac-2760]|uniref:type II toxin-antitoxin system Phd/YefM family antitoxin n=1 Tax=Rathayibacter sp. VKM Ac-2760 TaxID=2609253 RepID=UPI001318F4DD|nr:type II toxin-antitoxin system Phd/YefM family antitoxin [Rathayibacter sp. VKM Ac-2760]QHC57680.1 type II toxin-antitoxin system prevent-host-death family antitoxin [Rathayibacter sp. VKM Ac-2760]